MKHVTEVLTEARNLISDPKRWTQGAYARDAAGLRTEWDSPNAVCWCTIGAIGKAAEVASEHHPLVVRAIKQLKRAIGDRSISRFNDSHIHAQVMNGFDKAIAHRETSDGHI